jgi:hypothetical protein
VITLVLPSDLVLTVIALNVLAMISVGHELAVLVAEVAVKIFVVQRVRRSYCNLLPGQRCLVPFLALDRSLVFAYHVL